MDAVYTLIGLAFFSIVFGVPAYVIGKRREVVRPWVAFIPVFGFWIVVLKSTRHSPWLALAFAIPVVGLVGWIWLAAVVPAAHGRSGGWVLALIVPGIGAIGYWFYAFALPHAPLRTAAAAA